MKKEQSFYLPLNLRESSRLYWELGERGGFCSGEKQAWKYRSLSEEELLVLAVLQSRHDPRLLAILIDFLQKPRPTHSFDPILFKRLLREHRALPIVCVIGDFILEARPPQEIQDLFRFLMAGAKPVPTQLFYKGLYPLGGHKMQEVLDKPLWYFKKWGFLAVDAPLLKDKIGSKRTYLYDEPSRLAILKDLTQRSPVFRLKDYLHEISSSISRQQALKDIRSISWIKKKGCGKGTVYTVTKYPLKHP